MRRARRKMEVDTFPFLAVLLCAMGALILLLMVIDRRSKIVAQNKAYEQYLAQKRSREAEIAGRDEARKKAEDAQRAEWLAKKAELERKLQSEHDDLQKQRSSILADIAGLDAKMRDRSEAEKALLRKLADTRAAVTMSQAELDARQTEIEKARSEQEGNRRLREEMSQELFRLEAALRTLAERKRTEKPVFSLVPYTGKQGSNRRPIYVELNRDGAVFYPGKQRLTEHDWNAADFRRMVQERTGNLTADERTPSFDNKPAEGPYLLFLVRPDGINSYYAVLDALRGYKVDFGYELVEPDWKFDFAEDKVDALPWRQLTTLDVAPSNVTRPPPKTVSKNWRSPTEEAPSGEPTFRKMGLGGGSSGYRSGIPGTAAIPPPPGSAGGNGGGNGSYGGTGNGGGPGGSGIAGPGGGSTGPGAGVNLSNGGSGFGMPSVGFGNNPGGAANGPGGIGSAFGTPAFGSSGTGGAPGNGPGGGSTGPFAANLGSPIAGNQNGGGSGGNRPGFGMTNGAPSPGGTYPGSYGGNGTGSGPGGPYATTQSGGGPSGVPGGTGSGPLGPNAMNPQAGTASPGAPPYYGQGVSGIPNGGTPNGNFPNSGAPNGTYANSGLRNGGVPNGGYPNGGVPNGGAPNGNYPNSGAPNGNYANAGVPNGGVSNGGYPNTGNPNGGVPNGGAPNGNYPNPGNPNGGVPNGGYPNTGSPNGGVPNGGAPNGNYPNSGTPNGGVPNGGYPNTGSPNGGVANGGAPNGNYPNSGAPNGSYANAGVPNGGVPNGGTPNGNYPNAPPPNGNFASSGAPNGAVPNGGGNGSGPYVAGSSPSAGNPNTPFAMPNDLGGQQVPAAPKPPPTVGLPTVPQLPIAGLEPKVEPIDPAAQIAAAQAGQPADPSRAAGVGTPGRSNPNNGGEVDPLPNLLPPLPDHGPRVTPRPPSVGRLLGNRDFILTIDVVERGAILTPPGRAFDFSDPGAVGQVVAAIRKIADARQATVRPGETPYRVVVRFRVAGGGRRNYYTLYPAVQDLGYPTSRESLE